MPVSEQRLHESPPPIAELLKSVQQATPKSLKAGRRSAFHEFLPLYFDAAPFDDLARLNVEDLNGMALSHWELCQQIDPGKCRLRIINPAFDQHGWQSAHTVVELVSEDQHYIVSSMQTALAQAGHAVHLIVHPILSVQRNARGECLSVVSANNNQLCDIRNKPGNLEDSAETADSPGYHNESFIHIEIDRLVDSELQPLTKSLQNVMDILNFISQDRAAMHGHLRELSTTTGVGEQGAFLAWLDERQFTCLGMADVAIINGERLDDTAHAPLGLLDPDRNSEHWPIASLIPGEAVPMLAKNQDTVMICKGNYRSPVIRDEHVDLILLLWRDQQGQLERVSCIVGLFLSRLQNESTDSIPWLRERVESVINNAHVVPDSHDGKALSSILRGLPRDMLLQTPTNTLLEMATGIVSLQERHQIRLFNSTDPIGRFCNCLVYIPSDTYSRELRLKIESILLTHIDGISAEFHMRYSSESALARLHFVVQKRAPLNREVDWAAIEERIQQAAVTWHDRLVTHLHEQHDEASALALNHRYGSGFSANYREDYSARVAVADIGFIEQHVTPDAPVMSFYRHILADVGTVNFKLFTMANPVSLSDVIPIIENMGLRVEAEHPFEVKRRDDSSVWIHEFTVQHTGHSTLDAQSSAAHIQEAFGHIWRGAVENDGFNRLILDAGLSWRQVVILRSYCKYLLQIGVPFSQTYMIDSLVANHSITAMLVELFEQRFDPAQSAHDTTDIQQRLITALDSVVSLDEDRILRAYLNLVLATLRTNVYCVDAEGQGLDYVSYKFDSLAITDLPLPRPLTEIFVYSPYIEGIHLRGGRVARGGLRWSDRREDFRTEVLGLMKAQMVKNAVIVPVGSKGGFFVKMPLAAEREAAMKDVISCYKTFLRGLLDITDNIVADAVVPPANVVRYDSDDPYLVVAADKGTATFSDFANAVSADYGFWLGDAFASGGSVGYDHKKMGITARGAWESVKRHFRKLGHDTQAEPFTVAGIGDMAGDVFGNGMLLSDQIQLVVAFNHQHIFIDPTPDQASSFAERQRLFALPRSSWSDYNKKLLSAGGAIFSRKDKQIQLSAEAMQALGTDRDRLTPTELISVILCAPVDLLWNGGIGTYIKASTESHADAADRANDMLRVNANDLRCRVVGEGGNLGCTQRGRIEFARNGGMIYTDAIDNSAGVDCSDHEVNIKILLNAVVDCDDMTVKQRDTLLAEMTDEVADLVLLDNYLQTQCINQSHIGGSTALDEQSRFMQHLESIGRLDREIEFLPGGDEIADRTAAETGLSEPELAVLISYSKMVMYDDLLASDFASEPALEKVLIGYFPTVLGKRFKDRVLSHRLRPEIIATLVTNDLVNRLGPTFSFRMLQEFGATAADVASAFVAVRSIFNLPAIWTSIEKLDNRVTSEIQNQMQILVRGLVERATHWLLRTRRSDQGINTLISTFGPGISDLIASMPDCLALANRDTLDQRTQFFVDAGVPAETAMAVAQVVPLSSSLDVVEIAESVSQPVGSLAAVYFELGHHLELQWLRERIGELRVSSHWHTLARSELRSDLHYQQRHLCAEVASRTDHELDAEARVKEWSENNAAAVAKYSDLVIDMKASPAVDFAMLSLAVNEVHKLLRSDRPLAAA